MLGFSLDFVPHISKRGCGNCCTYALLCAKSGDLATAERELGAYAERVDAGEAEIAEKTVTGLRPLLSAEWLPKGIGEDPS